jgi:RNA polymerase sigma factor (sigma-70 family)
LKNPLIRSFLENKEHAELLTTAICYPTKENNSKLDQIFKKFYFQLRFTTYISNTLYFNAINFDKSNRKTNHRFPLTVDQPIEKEETTNKENIEDDSATITLEKIVRSSNIDDYIETIALVQALKLLTPKQKQVISLAYIYGLSDTNIAINLGCSQQAVSKLHKKALIKLRSHLLNEGSDSK